ncbi:MAG: hypothetical protein ACI9LN_003637 [Saprospiraceae bacterium]|jgi:hypothetical protein
MECIYDLINNVGDFVLRGVQSGLLTGLAPVKLNLLKLKRHRLGTVCRNDYPIFSKPHRGGTIDYM